MLLDLLATIEKIQKRIPVKTVVTFSNSYKDNDCWGICLTIEARINNQFFTQQHFFSKWEIEKVDKDAEYHKIKQICKQFKQAYQDSINA